MRLSGSGKSTLVALLERLYDSTLGQARPCAHALLAASPLWAAAVSGSVPVLHHLSAGT